jgi:hypothetical protein
MPDIKHTFSSGKMNKDLDERLVPNGEYRDAMNIQISTSEGSDIGAVQNILGNNLVSAEGSLYSNLSANPAYSTGRCIGSISNGQNDKFYWLVKDREIQATVGYSNAQIEFNDYMPKKDMIVEADASSSPSNPVIKPVVVDIFETKLIDFAGIDSDPNFGVGQNIYFRIESLADSDYMPKLGDTFTIYNYQTLSNYTPAPTKPAWQVVGVINDPVSGFSRIYTSLVPGVGGNIASLDFAQIVTAVSDPDNLIVTFTSKKALNFNPDPNKIITGLNIVDNLLFWTDDYSEPKKINIDRCKEHTPSFAISTKLPSGEFLQEKHITVIKPAPKTAPVLQLVPTQNFNQPGIISSFKFKDIFGSDLLPGFHGLEQDGTPKDYVNFSILNTTSSTPFTLVANQTIIHLKAAATNTLIYDTDGNGVYDQINQNFNQQYQTSADWDVRMMIVGGDAFLPNPVQSILTPTGAPLTGNVDVYAIILNMKENITRSTSSWVVNFEQAKDTLFEQKFPRFSYRYIYADGEYSPFAPFSEVAFLPSSYSMNSKQGYNTAMSNNLSKVVVEQFVTPGIPEDVEKIEILYKESNSPNVYIVDSITKNDNLGRFYAVSSNLPNLGVYEITSDTIFKTVASNQLLRPYDNVPVNALAQEVVGNRIVYANYLQNLNISDLIDNKVLTSVSYLQRVITDEFGQKSLKSLREYQLGVVYTDDYGRETPVLTDESSSIVIPITEASSATKLTAQITTAAPSEAKYFKFYVKETANEYYNLAMDRWYDARDDNIWISFNSADRNKVDEETFLYLKKAHGFDSPVLVPNKYKILAISNEAPDFIKLNLKQKRKITNMTSGSQNSLFPDDLEYPLPKTNTFLCAQALIDPSNELSDLSNPIVRFTNLTTNNVSKTYDITSIEDLGNELLFRIDGKFGFDMSFVEASNSTPSNPVMNDNITIEIFEGEIQDAPEFSGKFFVKIFKDFNISEFVESTLNNGQNLRVVEQLGVYNYDQDNVVTANGVLPSQAGGNDFEWERIYTDPTWSDTDTAAKIAQVVASSKELFGDGTSSDPDDPNGPKWFIDSLYHQGVAIRQLNTGQNSSADYYHRNLKYDDSLSYSNPSAPFFPNFQDVQHPNNTAPAGSGQTGGSSGTGIQQINRRKNNGVNLSQIDISIAGLPTISVSGSVGNGTTTNPYATNAKNFEWVYAQPNINNGQGEITQYFQDGQLIRFANDPDLIVYKIVNVEVFDIYNYSSTLRGPLQPFQIAPDDTMPNGGYSGTPFVPENNMFNSYNYRKTFRLTLDKPIGDNGRYSPTQDATQTSKVNIEFLASPDRINITEASSNPNPAVFETKPKDDLDLDLYYQISDSYPIEEHGQLKELDSYFNCYSFGNGVESNRIRDDFNAPTIDKGVRVSTVLESEYKQERRKSGLIYSGIYNSTSGINRTNQFIQAEKITKDLNPEYGSIQKLHTRNSDLVALCEDKVVRIYANKDALFNADGNINLTATDKVLGTAQPFAGEYGISKNPESFVTESYRNYFTDKQRGVVLRLSMDGLTPISNYGMSDYFKDNLKNSTMLIGSYDDKKSNYNLSLINSNPTLSTTVSFNESVNGWSSFKSFVPETGISLSNEYYTFKSGLAYKHHDDKNGYNNFYGIQTPSHVSVLLNDISGSVKNFKNLSYEGSQSQIIQNLDSRDNNYYNLEDKLGWYVEDITTDIESGYLNEFIEKENKWFNYIKGKDNMDTGKFTLQGIGTAFAFTAPPVSYTLTVQDIADED